MPEAGLLRPCSTSWSPRTLASVSTASGPIKCITIMGEPLEVLLLYPDGTGEIKIVGADLESGMRPQLLIPGGTFHTSRLHKGSAATAFALLGTTEWPGFESSDLELGEPTKLIAAFPALRRDIEEFTTYEEAAPR